MKKYTNKATYNITVTRESILKKKRFQVFLENGQRLVQDSESTGEIVPCSWAGVEKSSRSDDSLTMDAACTLADSLIHTWTTTAKNSWLPVRSTCTKSHSQSSVCCQTTKFCICTLCICFWHHATTIALARDARLFKFKLCMLVYATVYATDSLHSTFHPFLLFLPFRKRLKHHSFQSVFPLTL